MSQSQYKGVREILENEQLSIYSALDFVILYPFLRQLILKTASGTYSTGKSIHLLMGWIFGVFAILLFAFLWAILWPFVCVLFRFATFYIAMWIRVLSRKGGRKGRITNISILALYNIILFWLYIPIVLPFFGLYGNDILRFGNII